MRAGFVTRASRGYHVDEKTVENLQFHQDTVASDANSPLHLIREKEIEISGRMLGAKRQADGIVADARKSAAGIVGSAHDEGSELAKKEEEQIQLQVQREVEEVGAQAEREADSLQETIAQRKANATAFVVDSVVGG